MARDQPAEPAEQGPQVKTLHPSLLPVVSDSGLQVKGLWTAQQAGDQTELCSSYLQEKIEIVLY